MKRRRIGHHVGGGAEPPPDASDAAVRTAVKDALREALGGWPAGVTIVAVRADGRLHALTVSAFLAVSLEPPTILVSLGPNAAAAPYLEPGVTFGVSLLAGDQKGIASRFADTFPVGPSPFVEDGFGAPLVRDALAGLVCEVEEVLDRADHRLVIGAVRQVLPGRDAPALAWRHREYRVVE